MSSPILRTHDGTENVLGIKIDTYPCNNAKYCIQLGKAAHFGGNNMRTSTNTIVIKTTAILALARREGWVFETTPSTGWNLVVIPDEVTFEIWEYQPEWRSIARESALGMVLEAYLGV